jgi:uncharacterized protein (DUF58 family)
MKPESCKPLVTIRLERPLLMGLAVLLIILQLISPHRTWIILLCAVGGINLGAYLWARSLSHSVHMTRSLHYVVAQVGDLLEERFVLYNRGSWPVLWAEVQDLSDVPDYPPGRVVSVDGLQTYKWTVSVSCKRRGLYTLGPWLLCMREPFGLFGVVQTYEETRSLLVLPPVMQLPSVLLPRGAAVGRAAVRRSVADLTLNVSAIRCYVPGDPLRYLHWPSSAHCDTLMAKTFDAEVSGDLWIVLDLDSAVQAGEGEESTEEYGVILAASLAEQMLRRNRAVGLVTYGAHEVHLVPRRGEGQLWRILRALALVEAGEQHPLSAVLTQMRSELGHRTTVVIITPSTDPSWVEAVAWLLHRGALATAVLLDPATFEGQGDLSQVRSVLARLGIPTHMVPKGYPFRASRRTDEQAAAWQFKTTPLGRAIAVRTPREAGPWS